MIVWLFDSNSNSTYPYVYDGGFYDGREKTLRRAGVALQSRQYSGKSSRKTLTTGSKNIVKFLSSS